MKSNKSSLKKTTYFDVIQNLDFGDRNIKDDVDWENLMEALDIPNFGCWFDQNRLKVYFIEKWYCTDSFVGTRVYMLDGETVAISTQPARKCDEHFQFKGIESFKKLKAYVLSLIEEEQGEFKIDLFDIHDEIDLFYHIEYNSQILHKSAYLDNQKVQIIKSNFQSEGYQSPNYFHSVLIKKSNGTVMIVDCRELLFSRFTFNDVEIKEDLINVSKTTRASKDGKIIFCPICKTPVKVNHFSWAGMWCINSECGFSFNNRPTQSVLKNEWLVKK